VLSRVAESMFWLHRYVERAENVARFIVVNDSLTLGAGPEGGEQWLPLIATTGDQDFFEKHYGTADRDSVLWFLTFDKDYPNSILSCLAMARENGRTIRDYISPTMWEELNKFFLFVRDQASRSLRPEEARRFYAEVLRNGYLLQGVANATLSHAEGWHHARLGRMLERADKTSRILDVKYFLLLPEGQQAGSAIDLVQWSALLQSTDCAAEYHRHSGRIGPAKVAGFLILNPDFPRSIRHCVAKAEESLHAISGSPPGTFTNDAEKLLGRLRADLEYSTIHEIISAGMHEFIDGLQARINEVGQAVHETFFAVGLPHEPAGQQSQQG